MNIKTITAVFATAVWAMTSQAATPQVTAVSMTQPGPTRLVNIAYTLDNAPAVVTLDVQTNYTEGGMTKWASIGGQAVCNAQGDVWKKVGTSGTFNGSITWRPDQSWPDHVITDNGARAVVTAWALDNTPDYMVVDISEGAQQNTQKYYTSTNCLPGGLFGNPDYRTTKLVMRKIMAKDVEWTMGSTSMETQRDGSPKEATHTVTLTNNYYIGVFEITQAQWALIQTSYAQPSYYNNAAYRAMRPVEQVSYNEIRVSANSQYTAGGGFWPRDPNEGSFLGLLYTRTGIKFDLPSEAQWEFAARAGNGDTRWGDGSAILNSNEDGNMTRLGRYQFNGGGSSGNRPAADSDGTAGTAIVGSYAPNNWGLYDMFGNVQEWCLDFYEADITSYGGKVNVKLSNPEQNLSGATTERIIRGGCCLRAAAQCRPARRSSENATTRSSTYDLIGFRVVCTAGLQ